MKDSHLTTEFAPDELIKNLSSINTTYLDICDQLFQKKELLPTEATVKIINNYLSFIYKIYLQASENPEKISSFQKDYYNNIMELFEQATDKFYNTNSLEHLYNNEKDKRFKEEAWQKHFLFDFIKKSYLMTQNSFENFLKEINLSKDEALFSQFYSKQVFNAISPSNFINLNPEVVKEIINSKFSNIANGLQNFLEDLKRSKDLFRINTVDEQIFTIGENIASTEGKVIFKNELIELIYYEPKEKVHEIPLLIIPPWIKKYYILDLSPENSLIKWLVEHNYQVFTLSWINPNENHRDVSFEDYLQKGIIAAIDFLEHKLRYSKINTAGYCIGGTLLACALSYLSIKGRNIINSSTFFTTLLDFSGVGDFSLFTSEESISLIENLMEEKGYFDGEYLGFVFSLLKANDMIWPFIINNYYLGKKPAPMDILYWNSNNTNLPMKMHSFYLRNMYQKNLLKEKGGITLLGTPIDLSKVKIPSFFLSTIDDHIAPWKTTYLGMNAFSGEKNFCLSTSGHVAGVINPPSRNKYLYFTGTKNTQNPEEWQNSAKQHSGSWWPYFEGWLRKKSGKIVKEKTYHKIKNYLYKAPGEYIKM